MSKTYKFLCGVPDQYCEGGSYKTDQQQMPKKAHGSRAGAYRCMVHYIVRVLKWKPASEIYGRGTKGYINPDNGRVRILTKVSHFGALLREGKEGTRYQPERSRGVVIG